MVSSSSVLGIFVGSNTVHTTFFESVCEKTIKIHKHIGKKQNSLLKGFSLILSSLLIPKNYQTILTESCYYYPAFKKKLRLFNGKIINLNSSPILYTLHSGKFRGAMGKSLRMLLREIDGFLLLGKYGAEVLNKLNVKKPYRVVYPFIPEDRFKKISKIRAEIEGFSILTLTTPDYECKGTDLLLHAFEKVVTEFPQARLHIFGRADLSKELNKIPKNVAEKIIPHGYESVPEKIFSNRALFVSPGRGDTFPVATLEAMLAGIPAIVSEETGTKEVTEKLGKGFVVPLNQDLLADRIIGYLELPKSKKLQLSKKSKELAKKFREKPMVALFKRQFYSLLKDVS